ncbi:hypothetical protein MD484_g8971, partial [Candolleomyces efflorescens]
MADSVENSTTKVKTLPGRYERRAPRWDLAPSSLEEFMDEYEDLCREHNHPADEWIESFTRYAPDSETRELWKAFAKTLKPTDGWTEYRTTVIENTPGAGEDRRYTVADLDDLAVTYRVKTMRTRAQFNEYWRKFYLIASYLFDQGVISKKDKSEKLLSGLPDGLQRRVRAQLRIQFPTHHPNDPYELKNIYEAVTFILTAFDTEINNEFDDILIGGNRAVRAPEPIPVPVAPAVSGATTRQIYDATRLPEPPSQMDKFMNTFSNMMETFTNALVNNQGGNDRRDNPRAMMRFGNGGNGGFGSGGGGGFGFGNGGGGGFRQRTGCNFCSQEGHYIRECPVYEDYVSRGLCKRDPWGRVCFPDGMGITMGNSSGKDFAERVDNWHRARSAPSNTVVSSNLFDVVEEPEILPVATSFIEEVAAETGENEVDADDVAYYEALVQEGQQKLAAARHKMQLRSGGRGSYVPTTTSDTRKHAGVRKEAKDNTLAKDKSATSEVSNTSGREPAGDTDARRNQKVVSFNPIPSFVPPITPESFPKSQIVNSAPQYHYTTPIEDPRVVQKLVDRSLDSTITITTRELLSVAPDVRKVVKENVTTKRTPAAGFVNEACVGEVGVGEGVGVMNGGTSLPMNSDGKVMAREMETLRNIDVVLNDKVHIEALLDDGSQIIGIRRPFWEKLGLPLRSDRVITMESANRSRNDSMGLLTNLKMRIGDVDFWVQAQVMENVSYDLLLGRPFHTLTQAHMKHFANGDAHATLIDPNTGTTVTVPTKPRARKLKAGSLKVKVAAVDF